MNSNDHQKFIAVLTGVHDFYGKELSSFAGEVWMQACQRFSVEQVTKALSAHLMDAERGQWMPKPADIVRQLEGTHTDQSLIAWGKVHDAMRLIGAYQSVVFDDGAIHSAVIDMGGWPTLCRTEIDDLPFLQRRFCELHRVYIKRSGEFPNQLAGEHELTNGAKGFEATGPILIGDPVKAAEVARMGFSGAKTTITFGPYRPVAEVFKTLPGIDSF